MIKVLNSNYYWSEGSGKDFRTYIKSKPGNLKTYYEESLIAAQIIEANRSGKLHLFLSGGLDSEYMLRLFLNLRINFVPVIIRLLPDYNEHDIRNAFIFCQLHKLTPKIIDIDFDKFVDSGRILEIARSINASAYQVCSQAEAISNIDGTSICANGEPYIKLDPLTSTWNVVDYEYDFAMVKFFKDSNIDGTPSFPIFRHEQMYSYLESRRIKQLANNLLPGKLGSVTSKHIIYNENNELFLPKREKYHGYEVVEQRKIFTHPIFRELEKIKEKHSGEYQTDYFKFMENV